MDIGSILLDKSTAEARRLNQSFEFGSGRTIKFDNVCRATRFWHLTNANVELNMT